MNAAASLQVRAWLAVGLAVGWYACIALLLAALVYAPVHLLLTAGWTVQTRGIIALSFGAAGMLVWAMLPRGGRFVPPGPELTPQSHPRLFELIRSVAGATGGEVPSAVYLSPDASVGVCRHSVVLGFGGQRVLVLGYAALAGLSRAELRAVLAHEFGHLSGDELRFGPWIWEVRAAMLRSLERRAPRLPLLDVTVVKEQGRRPHEAAVLAYFRFTQSLARAQESRADRLSVLHAGKQASASALAEITRIHDAFPAFVASEYAHIVARGFRPPLAIGFQEYLDSRHVCSELGERGTLPKRSAPASPYDNHPPIAERIAAVCPGYVPGTPPSRSELALALLDRVDAMESQLLAHVYSPARAARLQPLDWSGVPARVWIPAWASACAPHCRSLAALRCGDLPRVMGGLEAFGARLAAAANLPGDRRAVAMQIVFAALALALVRAGWEVQGRPGEEIAFARAGEVVEARDLLGRLERGGEERESVAAWIEQAGLTSLPLWSDDAALAA